MTQNTEISPREQRVASIIDGVAKAHAEGDGWNLWSLRRDLASYDPPALHVACAAPGCTFAMLARDADQAEAIRQMHDRYSLHPETRVSTYGGGQA